MPRSTAVFIAILTIVAIGLGFNYYQKPFLRYFEAQVADSTPSASPSAAPVLDPISVALQELSTREKVAAILALPLTITEGEGEVQVATAASPATATAEATDAAEAARVARPSIEDVIQRLRPGYVTLFGSEISTTSASKAISSLPNSTRVAVDHEGGTVQRLNGEGFTQLPSWQSVCESSVASNAATIRKSATELQSVGVDIVLGPVVDVGTSAALGDRICGEDGEKVADQAIAIGKLYRESGLLPVYKHFPGIGGVDTDLHDAFDTTTVSPETAQLYRELLDVEYPTAVMATFVGVTNQFDSVPCALSRDCIGELERTYPQTLIFSDALEMESASGPMEGRDKPVPLERRSLDALRAGVDVLLYGPTVTAEKLETVVESIVTTAESDEDTATALDEAVRTQLQFWSGKNE